MTILIIEPFYGGSHKQLIDFLCSLCKDVELVTLTAKKWHWRARTSALYLSETIPYNDKYTHLFTSSVLNLCELMGLRPDLTSLKKIVYFHENQLVYPIRNVKESRDFQYGYNQILTSLCADIVLFNSYFNMNSFLDSIDSFLKLQPDYRIENVKTRLQPKCSVIYFPMVYPRITKRSSNSLVLRILWPHRWEHDKNPEMFFRVLFRLRDQGLRFQVSILGETFTDVPPIFQEAKITLADHIRHWGFLENKKEYYDVLAESDVVVSTAEHEFFGVAMMEAAYCGCYPLAPKRLVYPELFPPEFLYGTEQQLFKKLREFCKRPYIMKSKTKEIDFDKYSSDTITKLFKSTFDLQ